MEVEVGRYEGREVPRCSRSGIACAHCCWTIFKDIDRGAGLDQMTVTVLSYFVLRDYNDCRGGVLV